MIQFILSVSATSFGVSKAITSEYQERLCRYKRSILSFDHAKVQYLTQRTASLHIKFTGSPVLSFSVGHALGIYLPQFSEPSRASFTIREKAANQHLHTPVVRGYVECKTAFPKRQLPVYYLQAWFIKTQVTTSPEASPHATSGDYAILSANKPSFTTKRKLCRVIRKAMSHPFILRDGSEMNDCCALNVRNAHLVYSVLLNADCHVPARCAADAPPNCRRNENDSNCLVAQRA